MPEIIPTVVPERAEDIAAALSRSAFANTLHVDLADGTLTRNATWLPLTPNDFPASALSYEVHLMVAEPLALGLTCARAGVARIIAHIESFANAERARDAFALWKTAGAKEIGIALTMQKPLSTCDSYISLVDTVQLMTIQTIGEQGQPFDASAVARVSALQSRHPKLFIAVDGGVALENISELARAGARRFCVGAALARSDDPASTYEKLQQAVNAVS